jgi:hypothetical protein
MGLMLWGGSDWKIPGSEGSQTLCLVKAGRIDADTEKNERESVERE